jgi:ABC-type multidrug transport system ATPase subunit
LNKIIVNNLTYKFSKNNVLFSNINFNVEEGNIFGIYGKNGAGKSTLLKIIGGLLNVQNINNSEIIYNVNENTINHKDVNIYSSYIAPYYNLYEDFTLNELYKLILNIRNIENTHNKKEEFENYLIDFKLINKRNHKIKSYSSGMKQRCKIILGLLNDTPYYFFDEFSTNLDEEGIEVTKNKIIELKEKNKVILIATNENHEKSLCNDFHLLN